jgi:hypothetical protein
MHCHTFRRINILNVRDSKKKRRSITVESEVVIRHRYSYDTLQEPSPWRTAGFNLRPVNVGYLVNNCFPEYFSYPLSVSFHQSSKLINHRRYIILQIDIVSKYNK